MKGDVNDTLRSEGADAVRRRHDKAKKINSGDDISFDPKFTIKRFDDITITTTPNYLIKGIIPRAGLVVVWGPPKCGKSFWTFDLVMHVALGRHYRGRRVQQGSVVYLALEGGHGFRNRVEAWRRHHLNGHGAPVPFYLLDVPIDLVADRDKLVQAVRVQLDGQMPVIVCIDTLNRALAGDENKSDDMAKFIRAADVLRVAFGCVVIIIHHCGVVGSRPRGHTSLSGADDAQIAIERNGDGVVIATVEHMKDSETSAPMASRLHRVELGDDDDGDPITSCVIEPTDDAMAKKQPKLSADAKLGLELLRDLTIEAGETVTSNHIPIGTKVVPAILWRETFYNTRISDKSDKRYTLKHAFKRAAERLQAPHLIGIWSDKVWLAGQTGQAGTNGTCPVNDPDRRDRDIRDTHLKVCPVCPVPTVVDPGEYTTAGGASARDRLASAPWLQLIGAEPDGAVCVQCGSATHTVYLIRDPRLGAACQPLHEQCARFFFPPETKQRR